MNTAITLALLCTLTRAEENVGGAFVFREVRNGGRVHRFAIWLPSGFDRSRTWPGLVFLHGAGESGADPIAPTRVGIGPELQAHPERWPMVVVFPQKPSGETEWEEHEAMVYDVLAHARRAYRIDPKRVALTGASQGGHGAWMIAARRPAAWRAVAPVCGYGRARTIATRVAELPVWAFHGRLDDVVDPRETERIVAAIRTERTRRALDPEAVRATFYEAANHNCWDRAYAEPDLPAWLESMCRPR